MDNQQTDNGLGPSPAVAEVARSVTDHGYSDSVAGLRRAAQDHRGEVESRNQRPDPPVASDLIAGPGGLESVYFNDPDHKPVSARKAAAMLSELHRGQDAWIAETEGKLAERGASWDDVQIDANGQVTIPSAGAQAQPTTEPTRPGLTPEELAIANELQASLEAQRQRGYVEQQAKYALDQTSDQVRYGRQAIAQATAKLVAEFPEARDPQAWARLVAQNPARAQVAAYAAQQINAASAQTENLAFRHDAGVQELNAALHQQEDLRYAALHPDINSEKGPEIQRRALSSLKSAGFSEQELTAAWNSQAPVHLRDHRVQSYLHEAEQAKAELAALKQQISEARSGKPLPSSARRALPPPTTRPGVARDGYATAESEVREAAAALRSATGERSGARAGADLLRAMRAAGRV